MNSKFIVIILDGFGIGAMSDAEIVRLGDEKSNTLGSILKECPNLKLKNLESMGLMNAYGMESREMKFSESAVFGKCELLHEGADTFMGHQEIMGTLPKKPIIQPFQEKIVDIMKHLESNGHIVEVRRIDTLNYLLVDDYCAVGDNIDADLGIAYNCTAPLDFMSFDKVLEIGALVREIATVSRVISFGGTKTTIADILAAEETRNGKYVGIHAVKSKSYEHGYQCQHMGYGVDELVQVPTLLTNEGIPVSLFGKVADIVCNANGTSVSCVSTTDVLDLTISEINRLEYGFICTNVQETDLAGHSQNVTWYKELLETADDKIGEIIKLLQDGDILLVMADHGNDPNIGHNRHTRENVPLLIIKHGLSGYNLGLRKTLSDVGATICDFFKVQAPQNGISFIHNIK